jgi:hypothetical protein
MKLRPIATLALAALACAALAATASAGRGGNGHDQLYQFRGEVVSATSTTVQVTVEAGNRAALRAMLGAPQNQTFTLGAGTEVLVWHHGIPAVGSFADLHASDWVQVNVRAKAGSSLATITATPAGIVGDHVTAPGKAGKPLFLFRGTFTSATATTLSVHVTGGNRLALRKLLGQGADQTFTYDANTVFLLWQGKVPTVVAPSQLEAGDRIVVRIRAPRLSTLQQIESAPARHVGEHEPANAPDNA